jgi:hypothetical protein
MRIWRHLKMLLRAARAHDPAGAEATAEGELVVECPACPHPGRNLPVGWENAPLEVRYVDCIGKDGTCSSLAVSTGGFILYSWPPTRTSA